MEWNVLFFVNSVLLGLGLTMDAFSASLVNGLNEPCMKKGKAAIIAATFGAFQGVMPMLGWVCVHAFLQAFTAFQPVIPWIAFALLLIIGGKTLWEGIKENNARKKKSGTENGDTQQEAKRKPIGIGALLVQGIATSIDALSVGFTIAELPWYMALTEACIIAAITFGVCVAGVAIGKKFGTKLAGKASIVGGVILILIGLEIFITSFF